MVHSLIAGTRYCEQQTFRSADACVNERRLETKSAIITLVLRSQGPDFIFVRRGRDVAAERPYFGGFSNLLSSTGTLFLISLNLMMESPSGRSRRTVNG